MPSVGTRAVRVRARCGKESTCASLGCCVRVWRSECCSETAPSVTENGSAVRQRARGATRKCCRARFAVRGRLFDQVLRPVACSRRVMCPTLLPVAVCAEGGRWTCWLVVALCEQLLIICCCGVSRWRTVSLHPVCCEASHDQ